MIEKLKDILLSYCFLAFLSLTALSSSLEGQSLEQTMALAHQYYDASDYEVAIKTFQRVNFFDQDRAFECKYWIGESYFALGEFKSAARYFDQAYYLNDSDSIKNELGLRKTLCLIKLRQFPESLVELYAMSPIVTEGQAYRKHLYLAVASFGTEKFEQSEQHFRALLSPEDSLAAQQITTLFDDNERLDRLNPETAKWLSVFIPGAGQIYAGDFRSGLNSMVLNGALLFALFNTAAAYTFWDALISVFPWYYRYYMGGIDNAVDSVEKRKRKKRSEIYEDLLKVF